MKAKVIIDGEDNGKEFKVRRMTYTEVIANYPNKPGTKNFKFEEVKLISEWEIDDFLINNREFLKIRLSRGISVFLYKALKDSIEDEINEDLNILNLLRDRYSVNKKGNWSKEIICMVNNKIPLMVIATGHNFKRSGYNILVNPISKEHFLDAAEKEIKKINEEIKRKESIINAYLQAISEIKNSMTSQ
ncbi:hypothetical protein [Clostridium sp. HBUAS56017]|uniref:hypothetical protein n=1 Tax=Clostridium sp. HBUAS56017 TaxID=2571128 RepID=UPI0011778061|nr:hypothetical protein [Clostridium sp. HBUAS56017]